MNKSVIKMDGKYEYFHSILLSNPIFLCNTYCITHTIKSEKAMYTRNSPYGGAPALRTKYPTKTAINLSVFTLI